MRNRNKFFLWTFVLFVGAFFVFVAYNYQTFQGYIESGTEKYGYGGIFIFSFLADVLEQPLGPEVPASFGVLLGLNFYYVLLFSVLGSFIATYFSYWIGKRFLSERFLFACEVGKQKKYCKIFDKHGRLSLLIASISPVPYVFFCWLAGIFNMKLKDVFYFGVIPRAFRIAAVVFIVKFFFS